MTKSKRNKTASKRTAAQRFSGPELGELLDRVVAELGPAAEISEVNKIRSGGVAGFFCREEYEVIVEAAASAAASAKATVSAMTAADSSAVSSADSSADDPADISAASSAADGSDGASEVFGGPRPRAINGTDERFLALLERRLEETSEAEERSATRRVRRPAPRQTRKLPDPAAGTEHGGGARPALEPPASGRAHAAPYDLSVPEGPDFVGGDLSSQGRLANGFWARISKARSQLDAVLPSPSSLLAVIGPLSLTTPVVRRLRTETDLASADVIVLTDRAEIVSEPNWHLVRSGHQLIELANERNGRQTLLVIDVPVELPQWVAPLQQRLRLAGVGAFRYAVPGTPSSERLDRYRLCSDVPYVLDLVSRVEPERLVDFMNQQHPIGSIGGATLTPELLVAMQEQVDVGR